MAHTLYLDALMAQTDWAVREIAFHGGTSLRLSWNSARYSEDLDFLLSKNVQGLDKVAAKVEAAMIEMAHRLDPNFNIEVRDKTKNIDRMSSYVVTVSHPNYVGKVKVKAEFWRTQPAYLDNYPTQLRTPHNPLGALDFLATATHAVPAATLETAYADKLVAFATRPYVKWRDLYDLWWIATQTDAALNADSVCAQFLHNITAYETQGQAHPAQALMQFLHHDREALIAQADPDLKNWLPASIWKRLNPQGVEEIVDYVWHALTHVAGLVASRTEGRQAPRFNLKSAPRKRPN